MYRTVSTSTYATLSLDVMLRAVLCKHLLVSRCPGVLVSWCPGVLVSWCPDGISFHEFLNPKIWEDVYQHQHAPLVKISAPYVYNIPDFGNIIAIVDKANAAVIPPPRF